MVDQRSSLDDGSTLDPRDSLPELHILRLNLKPRLSYSIPTQICKIKINLCHIREPCLMNVMGMVNCWTIRNHHKALLFGCCVTSFREHSSQCQNFWGSPAHSLLWGWHCRSMMGLFLQFFAHSLRLHFGRIEFSVKTDHREWETQN